MTSKNQLLELIKMGNMRILAIFDLEKVLILPYFPSKYVYLVEVLNVPFGGLNFSALFHTVKAPKKWFFDRLFSFFEFVPRITPLQIELGS